MTLMTSQKQPAENREGSCTAGTRVSVAGGFHSIDSVCCWLGEDQGFVPTLAACAVPLLDGAAALAGAGRRSPQACAPPQSRPALAAAGGECCHRSSRRRPAAQHHTQLVCSSWEPLHIVSPLGCFIQPPVRRHESAAGHRT